MFVPVAKVLLGNFSRNIITKYFPSSKSEICLTRLQSVSSSCGLFLNLSSPVICRGICVSSQLKKKVDKITITFVKSDGQRVKRTAEVGDFIQEVIAEDDADFEGYGVCGGTLSCSTCHVILTPEDYARLGPVPDEEDDLVMYAPGNCDTSRLGCNVKLTKEMDGAVITIPAKRADMRTDPSS